ncbi:MAG: hypothetical protein ABI863_06365 [Ginsengibacter sp.]
MRRTLFFACVFCVLFCDLQAQQSDCVLLPPVVTIDFGAGNIQDVNTILPKYQRDYTTCPNDGFYSYASHTSGCFNADWLTFNGVHTSNAGGNMMLVNASETGGVFLNTTINGLKENTTYQFAAWMINVCRINGGCSPLPPNISVRILTTDGRRVAGFITGQLAQNDVLHWKKYFAFFVTPPGTSMLILNMEDNTPGGCGNDFAMDDITFCECIKPIASIQPARVPVLKPLVKQSPSIIKTEPKKTSVKPAPVKKDSPLVITKEQVANIPVMILPSIKGKPVPSSIPQPILIRENPVVKQIETAPGKMMIDLYDNGEIDGDTVSIYHNNELIISRAGLSDNPIHFEIKVDAMQPHHELVMVANNLGSIPPNTSLMIITVNDKRYEVHISSSEQTNAKVVVDIEK